MLCLENVRKAVFAAFSASLHVTSLLGSMQPALTEHVVKLLLLLLL